MYTNCNWLTDGLFAWLPQLKGIFNSFLIKDSFTLQAVLYFGATQFKKIAQNIDFQPFGDKQGKLPYIRTNCRIFRILESWAAAASSVAPDIISVIEHTHESGRDVALGV